MSYTPSIEDIAYLAESQPDKFSSPVQTLRSLGRALKHGNDTIGREIQATTVQAHYRHYLERGGQPLTESPIPAEPLDTGGRQDPILGSACVECASQTPCIGKVEIACHSGANPRVTLQGEGELVDTEGKIYFVASRFVTGEASFENFLHGTPLKDEGTLKITLADDCPHGHHSLNWTQPLSGTPIAPGESSIDFTLETQPRPTLFNIDMFEPPHLAYEVAAITLDILMNRAIMVKEQPFTVSLDNSGCFSFLAVTVPQLKFIGNVSLMPPNVGRRAIPRAEGAQLRHELGMGSTPRQVTHETGWQVSAALDIVCGNTTKRVDIGSRSQTTTTYDSAPSLRRQANANSQRSSVERFMATLTDATKRLAQELCNERDNSKLLDLYTEGPRLGLALGTEQSEVPGGPGLTWRLTAGVSIDFRFGVHVDIYQALKLAARRHPAGAALAEFMEDAEQGRHLGIVEYQITPALFIDVSLGIGARPSSGTTSNANLAFDYDFLTRDPGISGQISGSLTALAGGGISGYFDSIFTDRRVFKYAANVSTSGGITIKSGGNKQWGYELFHTGAMLQVMGYKKVNVGASADKPENSGFGSSSQNIQSIQNTQWVEDRKNINTYRLAEGYTGEFVPFS